MCALAIALPLPAAGAGEKTERTLDEITIEGEVPLPQVLFVSPMERARLDGVLSSLLAPSWRDVANRAQLPVALCIARPIEFSLLDPVGLGALPAGNAAKVSRPDSSHP
ncbi:MAG: hypothetical protein ACKVU1_06070 [bacterium]